MFEAEATEYAIVGWDKSSDPRDIFIPRIDKTKFNDWRNGAEFGYNSAIEWFNAKERIPVPKQLKIYRYTVEVISDKGDIVCYDYKDKCWKEIVIEDEKVIYVPVEIEMWCNKPTKESEK